MNPNYTTATISSKGRVRFRFVAGLIALLCLLLSSCCTRYKSCAMNSAYAITPASENTESYQTFTENQFLDSKDTPLSTFSIDVDTASYANMRRFIMAGQKPPRDAVRIEELINYLTYDYPQPQDGHPFSVTTEAGQCPWNKAHSLVLIGLQGKTIAMNELPPCNLVFLLDVSGSMADANKLPLRLRGFDDGGEKGAGERTGSDLAHHRQ